MVSAKINLQATQLVKASTCEKRYWYEEVYSRFNPPGVKESFGFGNKDWMEMGRFLHSTIELFLYEYQTKLPSFQRLFLIFKNIVMSKHGSDSLDKQQEGLDHLQSFYEFFIENQEYQINSVSIESKHEYLLDVCGYDVRVGSRIDHINKQYQSVHINDWKNRKNPKNRQGEEQKKPLMQLLLYSYVLRDVFTVSHLVECEILPNKVNLNSWEVDNQQHKEVEELIHKTVEKLASSHRNSDSWKEQRNEYCENCRIKNNCKAFNVNSNPLKLDTDNNYSLSRWDEILKKRSYYKQLYLF